MRALQLMDFGGPAALRLTDIPEPVVSKTQVLLDVVAVGINFPDLLAIRGEYQHRPDLPFVPGCEVAGIVRSAPPESGWSAGDRAAAFVWDGGYAEVAAVPLNALVRVRDDVELAVAAGMVVNYQTVHFGLARRGRLVAGETALILGAGGGIGSAAVQVARALGARVIAGVADEGQVQLARDGGASDVLVLEEGFAAGVRELTGGRGVDIVLDPLGDWIFGEALRALAPEGRILVVGFAAGAIPTLKVNRLLLRNVDAVGVGYGAFLDLDGRLMAATGATLSQMLADGLIAPHVGARYAFGDIPKALGLLEQGRIRGKAVALVGDRSEAHTNAGLRA